MALFNIVIEREPGNKASRINFAVECATVDDAWDYARSQHKTYGVAYRVVSVARPMTEDY